MAVLKRLKFAAALKPSTLNRRALEETSDADLAATERELAQLQATPHVHPRRSASRVDRCGWSYQSENSSAPLSR